MEFKEKYGYWLNITNKALNEMVKEKDSPETNIYSAMRYSLLAGGKRIRPVLSMAVCEMLDGCIDEVLPFACAIEMIHTYSLIHDDLPAMDNDDYRRGKLTNHKVYGEAMAILAGDALLNQAFEVMADAILLNPEKMSEKVRVMKIIANASGTNGMIGGQVVDLESEGKAISADTLEYMHRCKTGAIIKASVLTGAIIGGAGQDELANLEKFAEKLGLAFQIKDDILDIEGSFEIMGKKQGSDMAKGKSTFVTLYGIDKSKKMLMEYTDSAISYLCMFGERAEFLKKLALYLTSRED